MSQQSPESTPAAPLLNTRSVPLVRPQRQPRDAEIESIKRTLYNAIDKLEQMQRRDAALTTT
jgi:hypothetical protein